MDKILDVFELYADSEGKKVDKFKNKVDSNMKVKLETDKPKAELLWVEKMEDTLIYLENILGKPTRLIINEEEVVQIEKIKKVTVESIKHLSRNAAFIDDVDENGDVQPGKLLNVFKEETFNTYENRFIYTLVLKMLFIIRKEKSKLQKVANVPIKQYKTMDYTANSQSGKNKVDIQIVMNAYSESSEPSDEMKDLMERLDILEKKVFSLTLTPTFIALEKEKVSQITPPLKKNNVILKNVNFQYAAKLWDFLINEMEKQKPGNSEPEVKEYNNKRGKAKKYMDETFLLDYLILEAVEHPELKNRHKKEIIERLVANVIEKSMDVNENISEEQLKNLVSKQYRIIKYKKQVTTKQIEEVFRKHISQYVKQISK